MRDPKKAVTVAGAFLAGSLVGFAMWLVARQAAPGPVLPEPGRRVVAPVEVSGEEARQGPEVEEEGDGAQGEEAGADVPAETETHVEVAGGRDETERDGEAGEAQPRAPDAPRASPAPPGPQAPQAEEPAPPTPEPARPAAPEKTPAPPEPDEAERARLLREGWRVPEAPFRQTVEIALVPAKQAGSGQEFGHDPLPPPAIARCRLALGEADAAPQTPGAGSDRWMRVFGSGGEEIPSLVEAAPSAGQDGVEYDLYFRAREARAGDRFEVYYPAPAGGAAPLEAGSFGEGDVLVTVYGVEPGKIRGGRKRLRRLRDVVGAMKGSKPLGKPMRRTHIDDRESPYGPSDNYVAIYQSFVACRRNGDYYFGIDADDIAVLVVDGREVLTGGRPGQLPDRPFQYRTRRKLEAGLHTIALYHVQTTELLRARLAWQPVGASRLGIVPPSAFTSHLGARPVGLETRDRPGHAAFFRAEPVRMTVVNRSVPVTLWELVAPDLPRDIPGGRWVWREKENVLGEGREISVHCSGLRQRRAADPPSREITLELVDGEDVRSTYRRRLHALEVPPVEAESVTLRLELASAPGFVYRHEKLGLVLRAVNESDEPVALQVTERLSRVDPVAAAGGTEEARVLAEFELPPVGSPEDDPLAKRMNVISLDYAPEAYTQLDRIVYLLGFPGAPAVRLAVDLLSSREGALPRLRAERGGFLTAAGARAVFVVPYDRESDHRRFAFLKRLAGGRGDRRKALLYGDDLSSPGARGGEGLLPRMRAELGEGVELRHVRFPEGAYPIDAAVAGIDEVLLEADWGRIWISPGTLDVRAGTPVRKYARALDVLIDRVNALRRGARLVVVGPPPEWSREEVSRRYALAAREVAGQHRAALAELHDLVTGLAERAASPGSLWRDDADDVHFIYPLGAAMDEVAGEVLRH